MPSCTLGSITPGGSASYTVTVLIDPDVVGTITNTATVAGVATDPNGANNAASEDTEVFAEADLAITKTDSPDPVVAGTNLTYTLTVANAGPSDATDVVVTDTLPAGTSLVATSGCAEDPVGVPTCSLGTIAAGDDATFDVTVAVDATVLDGTSLTNSASVSSSATDPDSLNNSVTEPTAVIARADLTVTKSDSPDPVPAGSTLTYSVMVTNGGPSDAQDVVATDTLPAGMTLLATNGCAEDPAGVPTCSLGTIAAGASASYTAVVRVDAGTPDGTVRTNSVSASSSTTDPDTANNSTSEDTTVITRADLSVRKSDSPDPVIAGTNLTYTVAVINAGPSDAQDVTVTDTLPVGTTYISDTGSCVESPSGVLTCAIGTMADGASTSFDITVAVDASVLDGTVLTNSVSVDSSTTDPAAGNNSISAETTVIARADLSVTKSDSPDPVIAGTNVTYTVTVNNAGPSDAQNVTVTDTLPAGTSHVSDTVGCVEAPAGVLTCSLGALAVGGSVSFDVVVAVEPSVPHGTIVTNSVSVSSSTIDPVPANDGRNESTTVEAVAHLSIRKHDSVDPVVSGDSLTYIVTAANAGPSDAPAVVVVDRLPAGVTYVSDTGGCTQSPADTPHVRVRHRRPGWHRRFRNHSDSQPGIAGRFRFDQPSDGQFDDCRSRGRL